MNRTSLFLLMLCLIFGIALAFVSVLPYVVNFEEREGARPRDGIMVVRSEHIEIDSLEFYFITTINPNLIEVRLNTSLEEDLLSTHSYDDLLKPGILGVYFPYSVTLDLTYNPANIDFGTWSSEKFGNGVVFVKHIPCTSQQDCYLSEKDQVRFILEPDVKFDSQNNYRHSIKIKFDHPGGKANEIFREFEDTRKLVYGFTNFTKAHATIIIPELANHINPLPNPEPDTFHNSGNDYSNTQLDWQLVKNDHTFFVDFEMPDERKAFEDSQVIIALTGISLGSLVGIFSILYPIIHENKRKKIEQEKVKQVKRQIKWTLGDIEEGLESLKTNPPEITELKTNFSWTKIKEYVKILRSVTAFVAKDLDDDLRERLLGYTVFLERHFERATAGESVPFSSMCHSTKSIIAKFFPEFERERNESRELEQKHWEEQMDEMKKEEEEYWEKYYSDGKLDEYLAEQAMDDADEKFQDEDETTNEESDK